MRPQFVVGVPRMPRIPRVPRGRYESMYDEGGRCSGRRTIWPARRGRGGRRMWGPDIQPIIQASGEEARRLGSRLTRSAHLVLGLAASGQGSLPRFMAARAVTIEALRDLARRAIAATPEPPG